MSFLLFGRKKTKILVCFNIISYFCKKIIMISLIICSRNPIISEDLKQNIESTIGTNYEFVVVDNSLNNYSIFAAYNKALTIAKGDLLCFMHEDILYRTNNWGQKLESYFNAYERVGMVGVAGGHYLPDMPAAWWDTEMRSGQLLQGSVVDGEYKIIEEESWLEYKSNPTRVVSVDGLWMCFRKELFNDIRWDDHVFNGFHSYDTDISLQVWKAGYEVHIFWDILIEHKSVGKAQTEFYNSLDLLYEKWHNDLPMIKGVDISDGERVARKRIAELRHELFFSNYKLKQICSSRQYRWSGYLQHPSLLLNRILHHIKRIMRLEK